MLQQSRSYYAILSRFNRYICFKLYPRASKPHSVETLAVDRSRNLRYLWFPFICPNTVSTSTDRCFLNSAYCSLSSVRRAFCLSLSHRSLRSMVRFPFTWCIAFSADNICTIHIHIFPPLSNNRKQFFFSPFPCKQVFSRPGRHNIFLFCYIPNYQF